MKFTRLVLTLSLLTAAPSFAQAPKPVIREAATHEELANRLKNAAVEKPLEGFSPSHIEDPSKTNIPQDIIGRSDILCFNGIATLVPKEAIIFIPPQYKDRIAIQSGAKIVSFADFAAANRGWVATQEITIVQAEGKEPLAEKTTEHIVKGGNVVVAVYQGSPISKLAPKSTGSPAPTKSTP